MLCIEVIAFDNASVGEDKVQTSFGFEDVVEDRSEGGVDRHICFMEFRVGSLRFRCFFTPFDIHIEKVEVPATAFCKSSGDGEAHAAGCIAVRESSRMKEKGIVPPPVMRATLAVLDPLDSLFTAIVG